MGQPKNPMQRNLHPRGVVIILLWTLWPILYLIVYTWAFPWELSRHPIQVLFPPLMLPLVVTGFFWWLQPSDSGESLLFADPPRRDPWSVPPGGAAPPVQKTLPAVVAPISSDSATETPPLWQAPAPTSSADRLADALLNQDPVRLLHALAGALTALLLGVIVLVQLVY